MATLSKSITSVKDLKYDPKNARIHTEKNISMLIDGVHDVGLGRSVLIDEDGELIAGNGVVEAATAAGITKVRVIDTDGSEIIAVRRKDLKGKKKTRMALLDNRSQEVGGGWNTDVLKDLLKEDDAALRGLWGEEELSYLLEKKAFSPDDPISPESEKNKPPSSEIERVILWVPTDEHPDFQLKIRELGEVYNLVDITEIVTKALQVAHDKDVRN